MSSYHKAATSSVRFQNSLGRDVHSRSNDHPQSGLWRDPPSLSFVCPLTSSPCPRRSMEPRPYQAEAFDAARKSNVVMVGATGVGKVRKQRC